MFCFVKIKSIISRKLIKKGNRLSIKRVYLKNKIPRKQQYVPVQQKVSNFQIVFPAVKEKNNLILRKV